NETAVADAMQALQNALNDPTTDNATLEAATEALNDAVEAAADARQTALDAADDAIADAGNSDKSGAQSVIDAVQDLQDALSDPAATTDDIKNATDALNDAVANAYTDRDNAIAAAKEAMETDNTAPVSNEPTVIAGAGDLLEIINDSTTTIDQINAELGEFNDVVDDAKADRAEMVDNAQDLIAAINVSDTVFEPEVRSATDNLNNTLTSGANNEPGGLNSLIQAAIDKANQAQNTAQDIRNTAEEALATAQASEDADHPEVAGEMAEIRTILANPASSNAEIAQATVELNEALAKAAGSTVYPVSPRPLTWTLGGTGTASATVDADISKFLRLTLNGAEVSKDNYSVVGGSTIITFNTAYLNSLAVGSYVYVAEFSDGTGTILLNVQGEGSSVPATGDVNTLYLAVMILLTLVGMAIIAVDTYTRRRKQQH
ncbi:MAG TPA: hypothetical protein DEB24_05905, partial [Coriobacteriia bacterium]|nr:hypothetical protein [Coriobacteriia bacterium]